MNFLDFFFLLTIFLSILFGILKGFIRELIGLIFLALAVYCSITYYLKLSATLLSSIDDPDVSSFLAFLIIFFGFLVLGSLIGYTLKKIFIIGPMKSIDRVLGAFFGLLRGIVISCFVLMGLIIFPVNKNWVSESQLAPYARKPITWFASFFPESLAQHFKKTR